MNEKSFFKCEKCGNIVGIIKDCGPKVSCCGEEMNLLVPNTVEASEEKHVPVGEINGNMLSVKVGSVPHPMTKEHHIAWILIMQGNKTQRVELDKTGAPTATFCIDDGDVTIYEYCNLHGLWKSEIKKYYFNESVCSAEFPDGCNE